MSPSVQVFQCWKLGHFLHSLFAEESYSKCGTDFHGGARDTQGMWLIAGQHYIYRWILPFPWPGFIKVQLCHNWIAYYYIKFICRPI